MKQNKQRVDVFNLVLKAVWFNMIAADIKKEEYREITPYWAKRIGPLLKAPPAFISFGLGYATARPLMLIECKSVEINTGKEEWGAEPGKFYYVFKLVNIKSIKNHERKQ
jgi:hypothetical protein